MLSVSSPMDDMMTVKHGTLNATSTMHSSTNTRSPATGTAHDDKPIDRAGDRVGDCAPEVAVAECEEAGGAVERGWLAMLSSDEMLSTLPRPTKHRAHVSCAACNTIPQEHSVRDCTQLEGSHILPASIPLFCSLLVAAQVVGVANSGRFEQQCDHTALSHHAQQQLQ